MGVDLPAQRTGAAADLTPLRCEGSPELTREASMADVASGGLLTGETHLESLRDGRAVWIDGSRVDDVTTHPAFRIGTRPFGRAPVRRPARSGDTGRLSWAT